MQTFETIQLTQAKKVTTIWLNKPEVHNAFDEVMVDEITTAFKELGTDIETRIIVLRAKGESFSAGADLNWMEKVASYSPEENLKEAQNLAQCFHMIYSSSKPTIALIHGASFGGANGLLASCDIAISEENAMFSFSEVNLGIIPAVISPYVIKRIGEFPAKEMMLTGIKFNGNKAHQIGLVNVSCQHEDMEEQLDKYIQHLLSSGPKAISLCKNLIREVATKTFSGELIDFTARQIASVRASDEGKEGLKAFLEKRKTNWSI
jgi:methylglutaconyl-CoA hydratase